MDAYYWIRSHYSHRVVVSVASERVQSPIMRTSSTCFLSIHFGRNCLLNKESSAKQPQSDVSSLLTRKAKKWMNEWTGKHAKSGLVYFEEMQELEPTLKSTNNHEPAKCVAFWILNEMKTWSALGLKVAITFHSSSAKVNGNYCCRRN